VTLGSEVYSGLIFWNVFDQIFYLCKKEQKIFETCVLESLFTFIRAPHIPNVVAFSVYEKHPNKNHF
jgi:hypothetical protein